MCGGRGGVGELGSGSMREGVAVAVLEREEGGGQGGGREGEI